jgi:GT2 family glycosyltransferase
MNLAVLILNWNAVEDTDRCICGVQAWDAEPNVPQPTIWVVDNGSRKEGFERLRRAHPEVRFVCAGTNRGFAGGSNLGIQAALESGADAVLLLNNDAWLDGRCMATLLRVLASSPEIGVVGPSLWHGSSLIAAGGKDMARYSATHLRPNPLPSTVFDVDYVPGTAALVARRVFEVAGLLDEEYFFSGEMADLCLRARRRGFRCVADPTARAYHDLDRSAAIRERLHVYYVYRNRFLYIRKHYAGRKHWLYPLWVVRGAKAVLASLLCGNRRRARAIGLGLLDGVTGKFGGQNERVLG